MVKIKADDYLEILEVQNIDILKEKELLKDFRDKFSKPNEFQHDRENKEIEGFTEEDLFKIVYYAEHSTYKQMAKYFDTTVEVIDNLFNYCEFYLLEEEPSIVDVRKQIQHGKEQMMLNYFSFPEMQKHFHMTYKELSALEQKIFQFSSKAL